ncbi:ABC-type transporter Mla subunit MlaD [Labrenzia sp. EL_126]|nr:ABC-type transporter Mla subunit MlaD [Labrenzia sp. EL_126]
MIVDELIAVLGYDLRGEHDLRRFNQSLDQTARRVAAVGAAVAAVAVAASGFFAKSVIETTATFESFQATLETVEGSADKARASLDWISDFAKKTPFEVEELTLAFVRLRAYGMEPTNGLLEDLGNASSAMGKTLMDAVEMIADASTGEFERLKEFGIRAKQAGDQVTFSWTENGKTLTKTVKKSGEEITKFLQERFGARFAGAMERQSKTWKGMMSNLSDAWTDFQRRVGEAGFFEDVKAELGRLMDWIARLDADGTLDRWATNISMALSKTANLFSSFVVRIARHIETISDLMDRFSGAWSVIWPILAGIGIFMFPITALFAAAAIAIDDFLTYLRGGDSVIGDAIEWLSELHRALQEWADNLPSKIKEGIVNAFKSAFEAVKSVIMEFIGWAEEKLSALNPFSSKDNTAPAQVSSAEDYAAPLNNPLAAFANAQDNLAKMRGAPGSVEQTLNDNSEKSVTVNVGGVVVNGAQEASSTVGAAVGKAVGDSAASAAKVPPTRYSTSGGF